MELILSEWAKMEPSLPIFDTNAQFEKWERNGDKCAGMRHSNGERTGIVREVTLSGNFNIGSYKADREHGLQIWFFGSDGEV